MICAAALCVRPQVEASDSTTKTIYSNGLAPGWSDLSTGCIKCNVNDNVEVCRRATPGACAPVCASVRAACPKVNSPLTHPRSPPAAPRRLSRVLLRDRRAVGLARPRRLHALPRRRRPRPLGPWQRRVGRLHLPARYGRGPLLQVSTWNAAHALSGRLHACQEPHALVMHTCTWGCLGVMGAHRVGLCTWIMDAAFWDLHRPHAPQHRPISSSQTSRDVRLSRSDLDTNVVTILGSDDDQWIRISISIPNLANAGAVTKAASTYDRVVFKDVSGKGLFRGHWADRTGRALVFRGLWRFHSAAGPSCSAT